MHDAEVTVPDEQRPRRRSRRPAFDVAPYRRLFRLFRWLRAASPDALDELFFRRAFPGQSKRNRHRTVAVLVKEGWLSKLRLPHARIVYHLTRKSLATFADAGIDVPDTLRRAPTEEIGGYLWLLSTLRAELARQGFKIGRGPADCYALRRFLLDTANLDRRVADAMRSAAALRPPMVSSCERCGYRASVGALRMFCPTCDRRMSSMPADVAFTCAKCKATTSTPGPHVGPSGACDALMEEVDSVGVDIAWRLVDGRYDVRLLFVEHPTRGLGAQLEALPVKHLGAPKVPIILRSTDPDSRYDRKSAGWVVKGPRHQQLDRAFAEVGWPGFFAFAKTASVIDVRPDVQLHVMRSGAPAPAWECGAPWAGRGKLGVRAVEHEHEHERERERPRELVREQFRSEDLRHIDFAKLRAQQRRDEERAGALAIREPVREPVRERAPARVEIERADERGGGVRRR
jgi:hypothetical protein